MNPFEAVFWGALLSLQCLVIAPMLAFGIHFLRPGFGKHNKWRYLGIALFGISSLIIACLFIALATAPGFDFIDRCRPPGTGMCIDRRTFEAVRLEILGDFLLAGLLYIVLPIGLGAGGILLILHRITDKIAVK